MWVVSVCGLVCVDLYSENVCLYGVYDGLFS